MSFRSSQNLRKLIVAFIILLVLCETIAYVTTTPRPREQFFQLYVLGADHMASNYYPNNNTNIYLEEKIAWYLGVTNSIGTVQLLSIRVKVGNQTINPPNETTASPSPAPPVTDFAKFILDNDTWEIPFVWSILNITQSGAARRILTLQINNETYNISSWSATNGLNFRLIFELWTWQTDSNAFEYGWRTAGEHRAAWLQLWFNLASTRYIPPQPR